MHVENVGLYAMVDTKCFIFMKYNFQKKVYASLVFSLFVNSGNRKHIFEVQNCKQRNDIC